MIGASLRAERTSALATRAALMLLIASVVMAAVSLVANLSAIDDLTLQADQTLQLAMHASTVATLVFSLVAGLYSATTDHRFGLIDQRALSQPNRGDLLLAKALSSASVGLIYGLLGAATAASTGVAYYASQGERFDLTSPIVVRALGGLLLAAPLFAVLGVALGTLIRNQPVAIGGSLAWMLIIEPTALLGLPEMGRWFPGAAGLALTYSPDEALLAQGQGGLLLAAVTVIAIIAAARRLTTADL